ncbi:hypothetical protein UNDYM_4092 [Undibacterium sp. YM2]|nr:hypothetical protein UNDYM_4092 [Undibacterium sp. YM2]
MQKYCHKILQYYSLFVNCYRQLFICDLRLPQGMDELERSRRGRGSGGSQEECRPGNLMPQQELEQELGQEIEQEKSKR